MVASNMAVIVLLFLALTTEVLSQGERATLPLTLQPRPLKGGCPSQDEISEIHDKVRSLLQDTVEPIRRQAAQDLNGINSIHCWVDHSNGDTQHCFSEEQWNKLQDDIKEGIYTELQGELLSGLTTIQEMLWNTTNQIQSDLHNEITQVQGDLDQTESELNQNITLLHSEITQVQSDHDRTESELNQNITLLHSEITQVQSDHDRTESELNQNITLLHSKITQVQGDLDQTESELNQNITLLHSEITQVQSDHDRTESELNQNITLLHNEITQVQGDLDQTESELNQNITLLHSEITQVQSDLDQTESELNQNITLLHSEITQVQSDLDQTESELNQNITLLHSEIAQVQSDLDQTESELNQNITLLHSEIAQVQSDLDRTESELNQNITLLHSEITQVQSDLDRTESELNQNITLLENAIAELLHLLLPNSCKQLAETSPSLPSGYYSIYLNGTALPVYCDMDREGCNSTGGWTRVVYLNMTSPSHQCPSAWTEITSPIRTCGRSNGVGCDSVIFSTNGIQYSNVLGRVVGYQYGSPRAFSLGTGDIDSHYLDGVSITHGMPRDHICSFTASNVDNNRCPCDSSYTAPSFVGDDYFCGSGNPLGIVYSQFYPDDPLWDGQDCEATTCCTYNNPPWFCKELPQATTDDIEIRICGNRESVTNEDTPIELIEIFVQ